MLPSAETATQDTYRIEHYVRQPDNHWLLSEAIALDDSIDLPSISCTLALADVYEKVLIKSAPGNL